MANADEKTSREQWAARTDEHRTDFAPVEKPFKYQAAAWALWLAGIALEAAGMLVALGIGWFNLPILSDFPAITVLVVLAAGLALVLAAQRMWKKAGSLACGKKQGVLGVVMACVAYIPMCIFFIISKNTPTATKVIAVVSSLAAAVLLSAALFLALGDPVALMAPFA